MRKRLAELKTMLFSRNYNRLNRNIIDKNKKRENALKKVDKKRSDTVTLAITYHPKLPSVSGILTKHWKTMTRDKRAKIVFSQTSNGGVY